MTVKYFFILIIIFLFNCGYSFSQSELWARTAGGAGDDEAETLCFDAAGNVYVTGFFNSSSIVLGDKTLKNRGSDASDIFIAKYDPSGKLVWAKTAGGTGDEEPLGMSIDPSGNLYIRGFFESEVMSFDEVNLKNNNTEEVNMFLVKYDPSGKLLWAKGADAFASAHTLDAFGNVYVSGELTKGIKTSFDNINFTPLEDGTFIAKYNSEGKILWIKKGTGSEPFSISADGAGNVYVTGIITKTEHLIETGQKIVNAGPERTSDIFLMKLSPDGSILWEKTIGGKGDEEPRGQFVNASGHLYVVIRYTSISLNLGKDNHKNGGGDDLLLIKYDPSANIVWSKNAGGSGHDNPVFLVSDASENIYIAGHYYSDKITFDHLTLNNVGLNDIFIVKFSPDSKVLWAKTTGGNHHDYPNGLVADPSGNAYLIGEYNSSPNKDKITSEFFMEKYDVSGNSVWKSSEHRSEAFDFVFGESIDKAGNLYIVGYFGENLKFANTNYKTNGKKDLFILKYNVQASKVGDPANGKSKTVKKK